MPISIMGLISSLIGELLKEKLTYGRNWPDESSGP
jgi:hypothetical protein